MAAGLLIMPFLIRQLGNEGYGLWTLIGALVGYYGLMDFGVSAAVARLVAGHGARSEFDSVNTLVSTAAVLLGIVGVICLALTVVLVALFDDYFQIGAMPTRDVGLAIAVMGITIALQIPGGIFGGIIWGLERFDLQNSIDIPMTVIRTVLTLLFVGGEHALVTLSLITGACAIAAIALRVLVARRILPTLSVSRNRFQVAAAKTLYEYGFWLAALGSTRGIAPSIVTTAIGYLIGPAALTPYAIARQIVAYSNTLAITLTQVATPRAIAYGAQGADARQRELLFSGGQFALGLSLLLIGGIVGVGADFIEVWQGAHLIESAQILIILAAGELFPMSQWLTYSVIIACNGHRGLAAMSLLELATVVVVGSWAISEHGLVGAAIVLAVSATLYRGILLLIWGCRLLGVSTMTYCRFVIVPIVLRATIPVLAVATAGHFVTKASWTSLIVIGAVYVFVFGLMVFMPLLGWKRVFQCVSRK